MRACDLDALLRLKQLRAERATAGLAQAQAAERDAMQARLRAVQAVAQAAARRPGQEAEINARLGDGPVATRTLQTAMTRLAGLVAYAEVLRTQAAHTTHEQVQRRTATEAARRAQTRAERDAEAARLLHAGLHALEEARDEREQEAEAEDVAGGLRRRSLRS